MARQQADREPGRLEVRAVATSGHVFWALLQERGGGEGVSEGPAGPLGPLWKFRSSAGCAFGWEDGADSFLPAREGHGGAGGADSSPCPQGLPSLERGPSARVHGPGPRCVHMA